MSRADEINAQIANLKAEYQGAILTKKLNIVANMKADIALYGFNTTD